MAQGKELDSIVSEARDQMDVQHRVYLKEPVSKTAVDNQVVAKPETAISDYSSGLDNLLWQNTEYRDYFVSLPE